MRDILQVDFLGRNQEQKARKTTVVIAAVFTLVVACLAAFGASASYRAASKGTSVFQEFGNMFQVGNFIGFHMPGQSGDPNDPFNTPDGKINILLLGVGGDGHDGSQLTDTIIVASLDRKNNKIGLVSVPRDLAYPLGGERYEKINAVNAYAEKDHPGEGATYTAQAFSQLFNIRFDRVVKIDFKGFEEFVDNLGGLDINVPTSFTDNSFPTDDNGPNPNQWTSVSFKQGVEHMDGHRVLTFVRSRHGNNGEGSDFARSRRQQIVLDAIRSKLFSLGTLDDPKKVSSLWSSISSHVQTNLTAWDAIKLLPIATHFSSANIMSTVLTDAPDGQLVPRNLAGAFMLFPKNNDWEPIRNIMADPFTTAQSKEDALRPAQDVVIEVRNGTNLTGFASQVSDKLKKSGYTVLSTGNATLRNYQKSVIFDMTEGSMPDELAKLKQLLNANVSTISPIDGNLISADGSKERVNASTTQFLIILGTGSSNLMK